MSLSKTFYQLLKSGSTQEDPSQHDRKIVDWDVKNQNKSTRKLDFLGVRFEICFPSA